MIRLPRDAARVRELAERRAEQNARVFGFRVTAAPSIKKMSKSRSYPSPRGEKLREGRENLLHSGTSDRGRVINAWSAARRRNWNDPGKLKGGAKDIDWAGELAEMRRWGRAA